MKVEQEDATFGKEDAKWRSFFEGISQIEDFVRYLRNTSFEVANYYSRIYGVVCMRFEPDFRSNTRRNSEIFKRSQSLGFPLIAHNHVKGFVISI